MKDVTAFLSGSAAALACPSCSSSSWLGRTSQQGRRLKYKVKRRTRGLREQQQRWRLALGEGGPAQRLENDDYDHRDTVEGDLCNRGESESEVRDEDEFEGYGYMRNGGGGAWVGTKEQGEDGNGIEGNGTHTTENERQSFGWNNSKRNETENSDSFDEEHLNGFGHHGSILDSVPGMNDYDVLNSWQRVDTYVPLDSSVRSVHITSLSINLTGPTRNSLLYYENDLRPKIDYLDSNARERVLRALEIADLAHDGQKRKSGEPFIIHPVAVAAILAEMKMDRDCIIAGLLHDTVEDTPMTLEELEKLFGKDVAKIVEGETKFSKLTKKMRADQDSHKSRSQYRGGDTQSQNGTVRSSTKQSSTTFKSNEKVVRPLTSWEAKEQEDAKREAERQKQADNLRSMFLAMTEDVRVIIVKLADRLHNLRTLQHMPPAKQKKISKETLEFFTPLAHRLGMSRIKTELEELSFKYLYPNEYRSLSGELLAMNRRFKTDNLLSETSRQIRDMLVTDGIMHDMVKSVEVHGVHKPIYTVFRRMRKGVPLQSMRDIASIQVVLDLDKRASSSSACYHALGRIHNQWKPLPSRVKDYIAFPKPNGYQCLHTTVLVDQRYGLHPLEVHICTKDMHVIAEDGIVAELFQNNTNASRPRNGSLLAYTPESETDQSQASGGKERPDEEWKKRTKGWLITIREYIQEFSSSRDAVDAVRRDLLGNRVHVFTPQGRIVDLPNESTPVDLAYHIHTEIGHRMIGAKVNGHMVSLDYKLQNADSVKIITSGSAPGPRPEWMGYAKSRTARQKIRRFLRERDRDNMIDTGRNMLMKAARQRRDPVPSEAAISEALPRLVAVLNAPSGSRPIRSVDDLYIAIASKSDTGGCPTLEQITLDMLRDRRKSVFENAAPHAYHYKFQAPAVHPLIGDGDNEEEDIHDKPSIELGMCCHPLRGDQVVGVKDETRNRVIVHRIKCKCLADALRDDKGHSSMTDVRWSERKPKWSDPADVSVVEIEEKQNESKFVVSDGFGEPCQPGCIIVKAEDCDGLLSHLSGIISRCGKSIRRSATVTDPWTSIATFAFELLIEDVEELEGVLTQLDRESEVKSARRLGPNEKLRYFPAEPEPNGPIGWKDHFSMIDVVSSEDEEGNNYTRNGTEQRLGSLDTEMLQASNGNSLHWKESDDDDDISDEELDYRIASFRCQEGHRISPSEVEIDELD